MSRAILRYVLIALAVAALYPLAAMLVDLWCTLVLGHQLTRIYSSAESFAAALMLACPAIIAFVVLVLLKPFEPRAGDPR